MKEYVIALVSGKYFTAHKKYFVIDGSFESGVVVADDDNKDHYLSAEYLLNNFELVKEAIL